MSSPALDVSGSFSIFYGYTTFYPGKSIALTFENDTQLDPVPWRAYYNNQEDTGPLATGGDLYNFFVLGHYPDSYNPNNPDQCFKPESAISINSTKDSLTSDSLNSTTTSWSSFSNAYLPKPDVSQPNISNDGFLTGYFLHKIQTAVLSIPSFEAYDSDIINFTVTIGNFLQKSKAAGMIKFLINVQ